VLDQAHEQIDALVLLRHQRLPEPVRQRQRAQRSDGVDEQRMRAVERMNEAAVGQARPARRLHGAADLQGQLVGPLLPVGCAESLFTRERQSVP
jgi:hypothetical protein